MNLSTSFTRILFGILSVIFMVAYAIGISSVPTIWTYCWGVVLGLGVAALLFVLDSFFKRFNLRSFNTIALGLLFGYIMALALILIFDAILKISGVRPDHFFAEFVKIFLFLFALFLGSSATLRASDEIYASIPFVKFTPASQKVKDILLDLSALSDPRMIDLAAFGLLDKRLVLPRFLLQELHQMEESQDEMVSYKAKRSLEVVKKLETMPELALRYHDTDFRDIKESPIKVLRLARLLGADVLLADLNRAQALQVEGIRMMNLHALAQALKPLMRRGEFLKIKIQRYGKEERQGVGYLEDGTMVVVNGGGDFIGETINASVLSVKHTNSGRMIFCNVAEGEHSLYDDEETFS